MSKGKPVPLDRDALRSLLAPDTPPPLDLTKPAFGDLRPGENTPVPLAEREQGAFQWTRENYLDFIDRIRNVELDGPVAVEKLRDYIMRQLVALSGHPDPKVAIKALEMLGKVKNVGLFEEKSGRGGPSTADTEAIRAALTEASRLISIAR